MNCSTITELRFNWLEYIPKEYIFRVVVREEANSTAILEKNCELLTLP